MTSKRRNRSVTKDLCPLLIEFQFGTISGNSGNDVCLLQNCVYVFELLSQGGWSNGVCRDRALSCSRFPEFSEEYTPQFHANSLQSD